MRALATLIGILAPATVFASSSSRVDNSGFFVWIFLGFCALIVIAQIIPALLMFLGLAKGIAAKSEAKKVTVKF